MLLISISCVFCSVFLAVENCFCCITKMPARVVNSVEINTFCVISSSGVVVFVCVNRVLWENGE